MDRPRSKYEYDESLHGNIRTKDEEGVLLTDHRLSGYANK